MNKNIELNKRGKLGHSFSSFLTENCVVANPNDKWSKPSEKPRALLQMKEHRLLEIDVQKWSLCSKLGTTTALQYKYRNFNTRVGDETNSNTPIFWSDRPPRQTSWILVIMPHQPNCLPNLFTDSRSAGMQNWSKKTIYFLNRYESLNLFGFRLSEVHKSESTFTRSYEPRKICILSQGNIHFSTSERDAILCCVRSANMFMLIVLPFDVAQPCANVFSKRI